MKTAREIRMALIEKASESEEFRARLLSDPNSVIESEFGIPVPEGFSVKVVEDTAASAHLILPPDPSLSAEELAAVSGAGIYNDDSDWNDFV